MNLHKSHPPRQANWTARPEYPADGAVAARSRSDLPPKEVGRRAAIKVLGEREPRKTLRSSRDVITITRRTASGVMCGKAGLSSSQTSTGCRRSRPSTYSLSTQRRRQAHSITTVSCTERPTERP